MGFDRAGYDCRFQVEWDKHCQSILRKHWPEVPKWGDVSTVSGTELPPVDVLIFGSPCQDLSVAGKRAGLDGARSGLFHEAMRIIKEMRDATEDSFPRVVVWENVVGALSSNGGADFGTVLDQMAEAGAMVVEWAVLDAQHFGVPQRRRRVFVVAVFDSATAEGCPDPLLPVRESVRGDSAKGRKKGQATASEIASGVGGGGEGFRMLAFGAYADDDTASAMKARDYKDATDLVVEPFVKSRRAQTSDDDGTWVPGQVNPTLNQFDMGDTRATTAIVQPIPIQDGREIDKRQNGLGVAEPGAPAYTLDQTGAQAVAYSVREDAKANTFSATELDHANSLSSLWPSPQSHHAQMFITQPMSVRRLTPTECERLMGWPDDHTRWTDTGKEQTDTQRYRQCGNGVATPVAQWIAAHLKGIL